MSTGTLSGSSQKVLVHCLVVCTTASDPDFVCTPTWIGSRRDLTEEPMRSTDTLLHSLRSVSTAMGLRELFGWRRAMSEAPQTQGRVSSGIAARSMSRRTSARRRSVWSPEECRRASWEVGGPRTAWPCTRSGSKAGQGLANHLRVDGRDGSWAHRAQPVDRIQM